MSFLDRFRESKARAKARFKDRFQGHGSSRPSTPVPGVSTTSHNTLAPVATSPVSMHSDSAVATNNLINSPAASASTSAIATSHTAGDSGPDAQPVHSFLPRAPQPSQVPKAASNTEGIKWIALIKIVETLQKAAGTFGPLKLVVDELVKCAEIYERASNSRNEYAELQKELEGILEELRQHISSTSPPTMTTSIENLCKSIQEELAYVQGKNTEGMTRRFIKVEENADQVLLCYQRIRGYLRQLLLNANLDMWKIVDNLATDNRLKDLSPSHSARYDSAKAAELKRGPCAEGTRVEVLAQMYEWTHNLEIGRICWMNGMAGTGKTTIAYNLCAQLHEEKKLAASFFCSRLLPECRDVNLIIPSIAYQLARFSRPFRWALSQAIEEDPDAHTSLPRSQFETLITKPLLEVQATLPSNMVIVIDALDECDNKDSTRQILDVLLSNVSDLPVKFLVSSRPEPEIRDRMLSAKQIDSRIVLHELDKGQVQLDIETYLRAALEPMNPSPSEVEIAELVGRAGILFIYAATAVRYIGYDNFSRNAPARLQTVLSTPSSGKTNKDKEIDELYTTILRAALDDPGLEEAEREDMKLVLHTVICAQEPLTTRAISGLLEMDDNYRVHAALRPLWSVLHIVGTSDLATPLHTSFPDYMFDSTRSKEYYCDPTIHNSRVALLCFDLMKHTQPQFNICGLESSYVTDEDVPNLEQRINDAISTELFYACRHWVTHLCATSGSPELRDGLEDFLSARLLLWMEVMNLKKCMHTGPGKIHSTEKWVMLQSNLNELTELVWDALRFTTTFASNPISQSTPHIYVSMLPFWPSSSPISQHYLKYVKGMTEVSGTAVGWQMPALLLARWLPETRVVSATFSPDGTRIALAVDSQVHVLDAFSGRMALDPLQGHNNQVLSVGFSPDGSHIVSGSEDKVICLWDAQRGQMTAPPLQGHTGPVRSVTFSPDGSRVASGSDDHTICLWDSRNGQMLLGPLEGHTDWVASIAFSPDGTRIVSGSYDNLIRIWDSQSGHSLLNPLEGHTDWVLSVRFSPDGARVISGSRDATIRLWDVQTGETVLGPLTGHTRSVTSVAFSSDGSQIISGSRDRTVCIWNAQSGEMVSEPLTGHLNAITSVAFSPDDTRILSSSSRNLFGGPIPINIIPDYAVHLWDARAAQTMRSPLPGPTELARSVKFSPDGVLIASNSDDCRIYLWNARTGQMPLGPLMGHFGPIYAISFSPDSAHLVSGSADHSIRVWSVSSGETVLGPLNQHTGAVWSVDFSPDGIRIVSGSNDHTICLWDARSGELLLPPLEGHEYSVTSVSFSPDGTRIVSGSDDHTIRLWDASSGQMLLQGLPKALTSSWACSVCFSPDGTRIASGSYDGAIYLWDAHNGQRFPSKMHNNDPIWSVQFSPDGSRMISGSRNGSVCLWDAVTGKLLLSPLHGHTEEVISTIFSPDGTRAASLSPDKVIRVWDVRIGAVNEWEWKLNKDGWVVDAYSRLLIWVPPSLRRLLMWPRNTLLISCDGYIRLNFERALLGEAWVGCYSPC